MNYFNEKLISVPHMLRPPLGERHWPPIGGFFELQDNTVGKNRNSGKLTVGTWKSIDVLFSRATLQPGAFDQILTTNCCGH